MSEKRLLGRIVHKHDTEEHWLLATGFTPMAGEIIIYDVDANYNYVRVKVGDGVQNVNDLPFIDEAAIHESKTYTDAAVAASIADWNENDETSASYVKNRTHWVERNVIETLFSGDIDLVLGELKSIDKIDINTDNQYLVTWNGVEYTCVARSFYHPPTAHVWQVLGNGSYWSSNYRNDMPFAIATNSGGETCFITYEATGTYTIFISSIDETIHKIDTKYLPNLIGAKGTGDCAEVFNDYNQNEASGSYSHAEGYMTTASGYHSHAEGTSTTASGDDSHAEGFNTTASGFSGAHAEGRETTASEYASHAEGANTTSSGFASHAEGTGTTASGYGSHAEGVGVIAVSEAQHAQGKNNISDTTSAHIVGNGTSASERSNAHTIDWDGNAWFQGDVYVGSTSGVNKDEGSKKLATEEYVNETVAAAISEIEFITDETIDAICGSTIYTASEVEL